MYEWARSSFDNGTTFVHCLNLRNHRRKAVPKAFSFFCKVIPPLVGYQDRSYLEQSVRLTAARGWLAPAVGFSSSMMILDFVRQHNGGWRMSFFSGHLLNICFVVSVLVILGIEPSGTFTSNVIMIRTCQTSAKSQPPRRSPPLSHFPNGPFATITIKCEHFILSLDMQNLLHVLFSPEFMVATPTSTPFSHSAPTFSHSASPTPQHPHGNSMPLVSWVVSLTQSPR